MKLYLFPKNAKDVTGVRFGRLIPLHPTQQRKYGVIVWECRCDCGGIKFASVNDLTSGRTRSCGCLRKELREQFAQRASVYEDLSGRRFGRLTVLHRAEEKTKRIFGVCQCDCGNPALVDGYCLRTGATRSCGCLRQEYLHRKSLKKLSAQIFKEVL